MWFYVFRQVYIRMPTMNIMLKMFLQCLDTHCLLEIFATLTIAGFSKCDRARIQPNFGTLLVFESLHYLPLSHHALPSKVRFYTMWFVHGWQCGLWVKSEVYSLQNILSRNSLRQLFKPFLYRARLLRMSSVISSLSTESGLSYATTSVSPLDEISTSKTITSAVVLVILVVAFAYCVGAYYLYRFAQMNQKAINNVIGLQVQMYAPRKSQFSLFLFHGQGGRATDQHGASCLCTLDFDQSAGGRSSQH